MPQPYETHEKDPRRWVRRHHYQEGPGFLFLATQGGRPAGRAPRPRLARIRRRMAAVRLARREGVEAACAGVRRAATAHGTDVTAVELVGLLPAAELERCSEEFLAWSGLSPDQTIEARLGAAGSG